MAITAASIEANGWVLRVTHSAGLGTFASYALTPDATPKVTLTSTHAGFDASGGVAVANSAKPRAFVATKPLRKPAVASNAGVLNAPVIDETDLGGGSTRVRIALSKRIYATDAAVTLSVLAGWRTGESAASGIAVTNGSTQTVPVPIHRWADVPFKLQRSAFEVALLAFGFGPQGNQPVAAVKFTVTDGTTVKTYWTTALATSTEYADNLRCYRVTVDPATATALTAGLLRIDAEVYPWFGVMRPTDPAGTRSMTGLAAGGFQGAAQTPFVAAWDPTGSRYSFRTVVVDYANGTTTPAAAMVKTGTDEATALTAAKGVAAVSRAKDISTAMEALRLAGPTGFAAANGQPATAGGFTDIGGARIVLLAGTHANGYGTNSVSFAVISDESWLRVMGDPADANPRANVILRTSAAGGTTGSPSRTVFSSMTIETGYNLNIYSSFWWFDNIEFRGQTGFATSGAVLVAASGAGGVLPTHFTRCKAWKTNLSLDSTFGGNVNIKLIRKSEWRRGAMAGVIVTGRLIPESEDNSFTGPLGSQAAAGLNIGGAAGVASMYDHITAYNDLRACKDRWWSVSFATAANAGTTNNQVRRQVFFGNLCEKIGSYSDAGLSIGEGGSPTDIGEIIFEANTTKGERTNFVYNNPGTAGSVAATDAVTWQHTLGEVRNANNAFDVNPSKHDAYNDPAVQAQRAAASDPRAHGYRPFLTNGWADLYGVGREGNIELTNDPALLGVFVREYIGLRCRYDGAFVDGLYTFDNSRDAGGVVDATRTGLGNYKPLAGSPLIGRGTNSNSDRDLLNVARAAVFAAGAIGADAGGLVSLAPASARSASAAGPAPVGWSALLVAARGVAATRSGAPAVQWRGGLAGAPSVMAMRASAGRFEVVPATGTVIQLAPSNAMLSVHDGAGLMIQPAGSNPALAVRTIMIPDDFRVHSITLS